MKIKGLIQNLSIVIFFISISFPVSAQTAEIDSLYKLIGFETGVKKIDALNVLAFRQILIDYTLAEPTVKQSINLSKEFDYRAGLAEATVHQGVIENIKGNRAEGFQLLTSAKKLADKISAHGTEGYALTQVGNSC